MYSILNDKNKKFYQLALMKVGNLIKQFPTHIINCQISFSALWTFFFVYWKDLLFVIRYWKTFMVFRKRKAAPHIKELASCSQQDLSVLFCFVFLNKKFHRTLIIRQATWWPWWTKTQTWPLHNHMWTQSQDHGLSHRGDQTSPCPGYSEHLLLLYQLQFQRGSI